MTTFQPFKHNTTTAPQVSKPAKYDIPKYPNHVLNLASVPALEGFLWPVVHPEASPPAKSEGTNRYPAADDKLFPLEPKTHQIWLIVAFYTGWLHNVTT